MIAAHVRRVFLIAVCAVLLVPAGAAAQGDPGGDVQERLGRIGANLFSTNPDADAAIKELQAILAGEPDLAEAHLLLGIAYRAQGSPDLMGEAVAELRQAIDLKPSLVLARVTLGRVYLDMARAGRARDELTAALEQVPGHPQVLALLAEAERQNGQPARAVELAGQALEREPGFAEARYYMGLALLDLKEPARAVEQMELVVKSGTNPAEGQFGLGVASLAAGRPDTAITALREAIRLQPGRPETYIHLSRAYRSKGLLQEADKALTVALPAADAPGAITRNLDVDLHLEEGLLRLQQGRLDAAAAAFERVLQADGSHEDAARRLAEVRKRLRERSGRK